jgi:hypothetical protein
VAIDVREVLASARSLLGGGAAFIIGNSLLGIVLALFRPFRHNDSAIGDG